MDNEKTQDSFDFVLKEFKKESDRASVILIAAVIDEKLTTLLKSRLIPVPTGSDTFFEGGNAPLASFSSKIDLTFRLGLISPKMSRDIHLIRKIRNVFAHDIYGCNFENGSVKSRVLELEKSCTIMPFYEFMLKRKHSKVEAGTRGIFLFITSLIILYLDQLIKRINTLDSLEFNTELIYLEGIDMIEHWKKENGVDETDNETKD